MLSLLLLLVLLVIFVQTDWGQNWLARQVTGKLSKELQAKIAIDHVDIDFFNKMNLKGVYVEDQKRDTLLYAGTVSVRITDWFFLKDKAVLEYIGLEDAVVHFNRTDSVWNYAFLANYFAGSGTSTAKKKSGIQFNLKRVELDNVSFVQNDRWKGNDMSISVKQLNLDADNLSISDKLVVVEDVELVNPVFSTLDYPGKNNVSSTSVFDWTIQIKNATIKDGKFALHSGNYTASLRGFDPEHVVVSQINGNVKNLQIANNNITASINLKAKERSGFSIDKLATDFSITPDAYVFDKLVLQTPNSTISDYFALKPTGKNAFDNFIRAVGMEARFKNANISSADLAYFINDAASWNKRIRIDGHIEGTVDALAADNLSLWFGNNTFINGDVSVVGLPDINRTLLKIEANELRTTYADAVTLFPALRRVTTPDVQALKYLNFKGTFTGFVNDFVSYGTIETALGRLTTDINMKIPKNGTPVYSGVISTPGFQLGNFINDSKLGTVAFNGRVKGRSFDWNTISLNVDGTVQKLQYDGYTYQNISGSGIISRQQFNGDFSINDPNATASVSGLIDFSKAIPVFDATAQVQNADLKALGLTEDDIRLSGDFNLNMQGNSLSNLLGSARISNAELFANGKQLSFDFLDVSSYYINNERSLTINSNEFDGKINGNFDLSTLPSAFRLFLTRYYPAYIKAPNRVPPQDFSFDITTGIVDDYISLVDPRLTGFNNSHITGSLNTQANSMTIDADVPNFSFGQYAFTDVKLVGAGNLDSLVLTGSSSNAQLSESIILPELNFQVRASDDVSDIILNTTSNQLVNQAALALQLRTFDDGITLHFSPSTFVLNGKTWTIQQGGELNLRKSAVTHGQLVLREGMQEVKVETAASDIGDWSDVIVTIKDLNLADLSPLLLPSNRLEGSLSGTAILENPTGNLIINANLQGSGIKLDNDSLGSVLIRGRYNNVDGMLTAAGNNLDPNHRIDFDIAMDLKDTADNFLDRILLRPNNFQLKFLERFVGDLFANIEGFATGTVEISGEGTRRDFESKLAVRDAAFTVAFTQVRYNIQDTEIELRKDYLNLDNIIISDQQGNRARVSGGIRHSGFADMYFDIAVQTISPNMELLNTTYRDNQQFYGQARGTGSFVLIGPQYDMNLFIDATASETVPSTFTLPPAQTRETGLASFLIEKKYGREMTESERRGGETNITYEVNLTATPQVSVEVVLDELTGDIIRGRGRGNLRITSGTTAPLRINGRYDIEEGDYQYSFQTVFKKPFVLRRGANNFIEWNGDPYNANIRIEAYYTAENVSFAPLASTLIADEETSKNLARLRDDVRVVATLTGNLFQPTYNFRLEFPSGSTIFTQPSISFAIQQLERNPNELNKQVAFLIVTNSFAPYESSQNVGTRPFEEFTYNTVSGLLFNEINKQLNQILSRILPGNTFTLNLSGSLYNRNLINPDARGFRIFNRASSNISVATSLFSGRAILTVGGSFEVPIGDDIQQNFQLLPDVTLELLLNKTGSLRATLFYRKNVDFLNGLTTSGSPQTERYGTSLSYNKEFDSFREFLLGRKKKQQKQNALPPPVTKDIDD